MTTLSEVRSVRERCLLDDLSADAIASQAPLNFRMSRLELDGYMTGVLVAPNPIPPSRWMAAFLKDEPVLGNPAQAQYGLSAAVILFNSIGNRITESLRRLEADRVCDYRPAFMSSEDKPNPDAVRTWVGGFWKAMALSPSDWSALAADERTQPILAPFVGFIDLGADGAIELADDIDERLDEAAALIPRSILLLRKIADLRAARPGGSVWTRREKVGRNEPCPCGSGSKFKRCCARELFPVVQWTSLTSCPATRFF